MEFYVNVNLFVMCQGSVEWHIWRGSGVVIWWSIILVALAFRVWKYTVECVWLQFKQNKFINLLHYLSDPVSTLALSVASRHHRPDSETVLS